MKAIRYHDFSTGHKVTGHENKCAHLHGHNYRIHFYVAAPELDRVGRVMDFGVIKDLLCEWVEENYDHKFLIWEHDDNAQDLKRIDPEGVVITNYNPTAENMSKYIMKEVAPEVLSGTGCVLVKVIIEETRKCSVEHELEY